MGIEDAAESSGNRAFPGDDQELLGGEGRKAILAGNLVVHAISSALEAIPDTGFREELLGLLRVYPSPQRCKALALVYDNLMQTAKGGDPSGAQARLLILTKRLYDRPYNPSIKDEGGVVLSRIELVEEFGRIGKEIRRIAREATGSGWSDVAGAFLASQMDQCNSNANLVRIPRGVKRR